MNDRNSMFDDCHISQIHGQVVVRILCKQEILKLKTKMRILPKSLNNVIFILKSSMFVI